MTEPPQVRQRRGHRLFVAHAPKLHLGSGLYAPAGVDGKSHWDHIETRRPECPG